MKSFDEMKAEFLAKYKPENEPTLWRQVLWCVTQFLPARIIHAEVEPDSRETSPLFERYFVCRAPRWLGGWTAYIHHYLRSDPDRGPHDHPWNWAVAWQLAGGYDEERLTGFDPQGFRLRYVRRPAGRPYRLTGSDFHRVVARSGQTSWSLFIHGPRAKTWGFLRPLTKIFEEGKAPAQAWLFAPGPSSGNEDEAWWLTKPPGRAIERATP